MVPVRCLLLPKVCGNLPMWRSIFSGSLRHRRDETLRSYLESGTKESFLFSMVRNRWRVRMFLLF